MRRLSLVVLAVLVAASVSASTHTTRNFTAPQETRLTRARLKWNADTCARVNLAPSCTEAQAQVVDPAARVPVDTDAYLDVVLVRALLEIQTQQDNEDDTSHKTWWAALSPAQKASICAAMSPAPPVCRP